MDLDINKDSAYSNCDYIPGLEVSHELLKQLDPEIVKILDKNIGAYRLDEIKRVVNFFSNPNFDLFEIDFPSDQIREVFSEIEFTQALSVYYRTMHDLQEKGIVSFIRSTSNIPQEFYFDYEMCAEFGSQLLKVLGLSINHLPLISFNSSGNLYSAYTNMKIKNSIVFSDANFFGPPWPEKDQNLFKFNIGGTIEIVDLGRDELCISLGEAKNIKLTFVFRFKGNAIASMEIKSSTQIFHDYFGKFAQANLLIDKEAKLDITSNQILFHNTWNNYNCILVFNPDGKITHKAMVFGNGVLDANLSSVIPTKQTLRNFFGINHITNSLLSLRRYSSYWLKKTYQHYPPELKYPFYFEVQNIFPKLDAEE
jgi:hypothetical protein